MGKTLLIAALLVATATTAHAGQVTRCHSSGDEKDCVTKNELPTEEDIAEAHHLSNFWAARQEWRKEHCTMINEWGQLKEENPALVAGEGGEVVAGVVQGRGSIWGNTPIGMRKYVFDQCRKPY